MWDGHSRSIRPGGEQEDYSLMIKQFQVTTSMLPTLKCKPFLDFLWHVRNKKKSKKIKGQIKTKPM
jgi:hypothetical protein